MNIQMLLYTLVHLKLFRAKRDHNGGLSCLSKKSNKELCCSSKGSDTAPRSLRLRFALEMVLNAQWDRCVMPRHPIVSCL